MEGHLRLEVGVGSVDESGEATPSLREGVASPDHRVGTKLCTTLRQKFT